jgi:hypothetical protein
VPSWRLPSVFVTCASAVWAGASMLPQAATSARIASLELRKGLTQSKLGATSDGPASSSDLASLIASRHVAIEPVASRCVSRWAIIAGHAETLEPPVALIVAAHSVPGSCLQHLSKIRTEKGEHAKTSPQTSQSPVHAGWCSLKVGSQGMMQSTSYPGMVVLVLFVAPIQNLPIAAVQISCACSCYSVVAVGSGMLGCRKSAG